MPRSNSSASGDRRDFGGKVPQFELFADKIYVELTRHNLAWIKVGDADAGNADDIQYATRTEVHAYQVKWSQQTQKPPYRYLEFINILPELRQSWLKLSKVNAELGLPVYIYLLTNRSSSEHDRLIIDDAPAKSVGSFSDFLSQAWPDINSGTKPMGNWGLLLEQELIKLNLTETEFLTFSQHLRLEFNATLPQPTNHRHHDIYQQDVTNLYKFFHDELAQLMGQVSFTADELIRKMQWEGRLKAIFSHDFYVDPKIYQPNITTIETLSQSIESLPGGYIFLEGSPGSGKSSLLTKWATGRPERVVKYFAYLNQTNGNQPIRGEAVNLFHDLTIQLTESGFFGSTVLGAQRDLTLTQQIFQNQLKQVGDIYQQDCTKTIIIIDGLDHIPREYAKQGTLLEHLPHPNDIRPGVYIILGSQSFDLASLNVSVRQEVEQIGRHIVVRPLLPSAISKIADSYLAEQLNPTQHDLLFQISGGHPLFLQYILRTIKNETNDRPIEEIVAPLPPFDQDISLYYNRIWQEFETDEDIADLLGLVSRLRFGFHYGMRNEWGVSASVARKAKRWFNQFFDESFGFKVFFHNSFRQFLLYKTAEDPLSGQYDKTAHENFHVRLADWSETSSIRLFHHEHLYHVHQAAQIDRFYQTLTPAYVDNQRYNFRPFDAIRDDLIMGLQLAAKDQNMQLMLRYGFLMGELHRREHNLDESNFLDYFPTLFDFEAITEYALLPINSPERRSRAMEIVRLLYRNGYETDARRLFAFAEPAAYAVEELILDSEKGHHWQEQANSLKEWVRTKCLWSDPEEMLEKVLNIKIVSDNTDNTYEEQKLQTQLLDALIQSLTHTKSLRQLLLKIFSRFDFGHPGNISFFLPRLYDVVDILIQDDEGELAVFLLDTCLSSLNPASLSIDQRILLANMLYEIDTNSQKYQDWIRDVVLNPITSIPTDIRTDGSLDYYLPYFRYVALETVQYKTVDLSILFPNAPSDRYYDPIVTDWFKMMARTAIIKGEGLRGERFNSRNLLPIIRFYYRPKPHLSETSQTRVEWSRNSYYRQIVESIVVYGSKAFSEAATLFETEINQNITYWSAELQFEVWITFLRLGLDKERLRGLINGIAGAIIEEQGDLYSRMNLALKLSETYLSLGAFETAQFWLRRSADESFGVGFRKDYQFNDWIAWLTKANVVEPEKARERIRWIASYLKHIDQTTDGKAASGRAAYGLLKCCIKWDTATGLDLLDWLLKKLYIDVDDGIELILDNLLQEEVSSDLLSCIADLFGKVLLLSSKSASSKTFSHLILLLQQHQQPELINEIVEDVERYALQENRPEYYDLLRKANVSFSPAKGFPMDQREHKEKSEATVRLRNDTRISQAAFIEKFTTASELQNLISQVYETSGKFNWQACLLKVVHEIDEPWLIQTSTVIIADTHSSFLLILALGELAYQKVYTSAVKNISTKLLSIDDASWSPFNDGGLRLRAFEFAIKVEGDLARKAAWLDFIRQFERSSAVELLRELDEIIPVLSTSSDIRSIWLEIESYLSRMFLHIEASTDVPELIAAPIDNQPEALIARLACNLSLIAECGLRETALVHLAKQTAMGYTGYIEEIRRFVKDITVDIDQEIFAKIVLYVGEIDLVVLAKFTNELQKLSRSSLLSSRIAANVLLQKLNEPIQPSPLIQRPLAWLRMPSSRINQDKELHRFNEAMSELWIGSRFSKERLFNMLMYHLETVGKITSFDAYALFSRTVDLLIIELGRGDSRLKKLANGSEIKLETTYSPYFVIVSFLTDTLLNELWEGGYLPDLHEVAWLNSLVDPQIFQLEQHRRPEELPGVRGFEDYYTLPSDWIEQIKDGFIHFTKQLGNRIVIAERTIFRGLGWDLASETRESCLTINEGKSSYEFQTGVLYRKENLLIADYVEMSQTHSTLTPSTPLIFANHADRFIDTPTHLSEWVAINPEIAQLLGWRLADPLKFQWIDENDSIMTESFFWVDGNIRMTPPQFRSQAGCGWIVTASQEAFSTLKAKFNLIQKSQLDRQTHDSSTRKPFRKTLQHIEKII
ncbi:hypothetical protein [Spirosoma pollinicola]|uniref:NACHT domain-containing protein n=1 Tax=Spirosoma pollinicola TaxID=2057025 RepID=A0A2K8Z2D3_9BACT|nr:hypothetical protein [Spirosoma pollinicola]AUD04040.1 hypothetical protein CWM47_20730 [Spirosoma pollinicola]